MAKAGIANSRHNRRIGSKAIKTAILQGQYAASNGSNRIQLATYFAIGKYISLNSRQGFWGKVVNVLWKLG